jgi:hypothetical protein
VNDRASATAVARLYHKLRSLNHPNTATASQAKDEAIVRAPKVSVTAMHVSFDHSLVVQVWLQRHLRELFR